jgi:hypothetical protein
MTTESTADYAIVKPDDADDAYAGSDVPGEFRSLTRELGCRQLAVTLIRVPPPIRTSSRARVISTTRSRSCIW